MIRVPLGLSLAQCPHCKSIEYRNADTRNGFERAIHWMVRPYWCSMCGHHFYLRRGLDSKILLDQVNSVN